MRDKLNDVLGDVSEGGSKKNPNKQKETNSRPEKTQTQKNQNPQVWKDSAKQVCQHKALL